MIYTSYFANWRKFPAGFDQYSIARFSPVGFKGKSLLELSPSQEILSKYKNKKISNEEYEKLYIDQLKSIDVLSILNKLGNSILLCYEKKEDFCHRHILSKYVKEKFNISIIEL